MIPCRTLLLVGAGGKGVLMVVMGVCRYACDVDINELIRLDEVMDELQLGPNGGKYMYVDSRMHRRMHGYIDLYTRLYTRLSTRLYRFIYTFI